MSKNINYFLLGIALLILFTISNVVFFAPTLFHYALVALSLGLRHGLDADHIMAIDNVTRKLTFEKKSARNTGLFFALGHSTVVFFMTLLLVLGLHHSQTFYTHLKEIGDRIGSLISIAFLTLTLILNLTLNRTAFSTTYNTGLMYKIAKYLFKIIDCPQKMYIVGFFFGLGFDTATEIGLLSLAATSLIHGFNLTFILLLPILFASGMVITDTLNSSFMTHLYTRVNQNQDKLKAYNYFILSFVSLTTLFVIGVESFNYLKGSTIITSSVMLVITKLGNNSNSIGAIIAMVFVLLSLFIYKKTSPTSPTSESNPMQTTP